VDRNEKTIELIRQYQSREADTRNEIIQLNMPLAHFYTKKLKPYDMEYEDALSMTMAAFSQTIEKFDLSRETKFSTYASMQVLTVFSHIYKKQNAKKRQGVVVSLDAPTCESEGSTLTLLDTVAAPEQDHLMKSEALRLTKQVLDQFKSRDKKVITAVLNETGTQLEIGKMHGVSQISVSRIMKKFYAALKQEAQRQGYRKKEEQSMTPSIMSVDQYKGFVDQGLTIPEIAHKIGKKPKSIYTWRYSHKKQIAHFEPKLAENTSKKAKKVSKTDNLKSNGSSIEKELAAYKIMVDERSKRLGELSNENNQLTVKLDETQKELLLANDKYEREARANDSLREEVEKLSKAFDDANSNYNAKCEQINDLNATVNDLRNDNNIFKQRLAYITHERDELCASSSKFENQLRALEAYVLTLLEPAK
jgi:RNA polymerase sporulation-specific sigma factor